MDVLMNSFLSSKELISSLADTDLYKLTMMQVVFEKYMNVKVRYDFKCRNMHILNNVFDATSFLAMVRAEVANLCSLRFTKDELNYLSSKKFFKPGFIEFLRLFQLNLEYVNIYIEKNNDIAIVIEGPWISTILFEVPILAIISETYSIFRNDLVLSTHTKRNSIDIFNNKIKVLFNKIPSNILLNNLYITDLGTRRRFSFENQKLILESMIANNMLSGTSNVHFARTLNIKAVGTMAHEYVCAHQQLGRVEDSQKAAFQAWADVYRGDLGIALSDTVGFSAFLRDFDLYFAKLFDGARHDSGDPYEWCEKLISHYEKLNIDPKTKIAVFSDGLTFSSIVDLFNTFNERIKVSFGIGTNLTNDVGLEPLQIVMKMTECNNRPVAKVSDSTGKGMCLDPNFEAYIKNIFKEKQNEI